MNTVTIDRARFDQAGQVANELEAHLASRSRSRRSTLIYLIHLGDGLAYEAEVAARKKEAELRLNGYTVTRHQTSRGTPYVKAEEVSL